MSTSSLPEDYSLTSNDIITLTSDTISTSDINTITLTSSGTGSTTIGNISFNASTGMYTTYGAAGTTYTIGSGIDTITIDTSHFENLFPKEWKDKFPEWGRIQKMCEQYPSLEIALRNFKTIYELVKDDYDNPTPKK